MARTQTKADIQEFPVTDLLEKNTAELAVSMTANDIAAVLIMDAEEALKMVGRIEAADFLATVAEKMIAETAIALKQGKKYKGLPFIDENKNRRQVATFEEFCEYKLGKSRRRVDELINNYNQLGPELYEQAERLGFRQRDYNALKALPADDKLLIAQAIEEESLDRALDLMQEMAAKHQREKEITSKQLDELIKSVEAKDSVIKGKSAELDKKNEQLARLQLEKSAKVDEVAMPGEYQLMRLQEYSRELTAKITATFNAEIIKLYKEFEGFQPPKHIELAARQAVGLIITAAYGVAENMGIEPILDADQAADDPAKADAEAFLAYQAEQISGFIVDPEDIDEGNGEDDAEDFDDFFAETPSLARGKKQDKDKKKLLIDYTDEDWARLKNTEA